MSVTNSFLYTGEAVLGSTPGVPLAADSSGNLVSGLTTFSVTATSTASTVATTDVVITGMTLTPTPGTYLAMFSTSFTSTTAGATITYTLYNNGVAEPATATVISPYSGGLSSSANSIGAGFLQKPITVTAGAVDIRWKVSAGTVTCSTRSLTLLRLS